MLSSVLLMLISLTAFLILTEIVTVNILYDEALQIDFNLMVFGVSFTKKKTQKNKSKKRKKSPASAKAVIGFISRLAERSEITLRSISIPNTNAAPSATAIGQGFLSVILAALLGFGKNNAKKFTLLSINNSDSENNSIKFDVGIKITLFNFILSALPFLFDSASAFIKNRKEKNNNGRKQNERAN